MSMTEAAAVQHGPEIAEAAAYPLVTKLVEYLPITDTKILEDEVLSIPHKTPGVDGSRLQKAISFMNEIHEGQERIYDDKPPGHKKAYTTHTLTSALMTYELMKDEVPAESLTDSIIVSLLHDGMEDGRIKVDEQTTRAVTKADIDKRFGPRVANAVEALSHVRDEEYRGQTYRVKLLPEVYADKMQQYHEEVDPEIGIFYIKVGGDRGHNLGDPFKRAEGLIDEVIFDRIYHNADKPVKKPLRTSRKEQLAHTEKYLLPRIGDNPKLQTFIHNVMDLSRLTLKRKFDPSKWKQQLAAYQKRHPRRK